MEHIAFFQFREMRTFVSSSPPNLGLAALVYGFRGLRAALSLLSWHKIYSGLLTVSCVTSDGVYLVVSPTSPLLLALCF